MALGGNASALFAMQTRNVVVAVVEGGREVSGSATGFAAADRAIIYENHRATGSREKIRGSHARDSGTDYANIRSKILRERLKLRDFSSIHPDGGRVT